MADAIVVNLAGLLASKLGTTQCAGTYLHDIRRAVGQTDLPALAVYVSEEEIVAERGGVMRHEAVVSLDYYLGPIEQDVMNDRWSELRVAATDIANAVRVGYDPAWPIATVPPTIAPGTALLDFVTGLQGFTTQGKVKYGYFHPITPGAGASYLGFRWSLLVLHDGTSEPADITLLGPLVGHFNVPAEGALPAGILLEFQPLAAPPP